MARYFLTTLVLITLAVLAESVPPGLSIPSHARCMDDRYKECYNLDHVCPLFCPDTCTVNCVSCKPICGNWTSPPEVPRPPPPTPSVLTPPPSSPPPPAVLIPPVYPPPPPSVVPSSNSDPPPSEPPPFATPPPSEPPPSATPPIATTPPPYEPPPSPPSATPPAASEPPPSPPSATPPTASEPLPSPPSEPPPSPPSANPPTATTPPPSEPPPSPPSATPPTATTPPSATPPTTPPPPPPSTEASGEQRVRCRNRNYPQCYGRMLTCPTACPKCFVDCNTCKAVCQCDYPGAVCQDPRFIGGDGVTFYFHGKKDEDFCLVTDPDLHINAHFIGRRNKNMRRDFTWVQSIGVLFKNHRLFIEAMKTATWDDSTDRLNLSFDGEQVLLPEIDGASWQSATEPAVTMTRAGGDTNIVTVHVEGRLKITAKVVPITEHDSRVHNYEVTRDDCLAHLDLSFKFYTLTNDVDGVLGQTYRPGYVSRVKIGTPMPVMGGDDKFRASGLFQADCAVARFDKGGEAAATMVEIPSIGCSSRMDGRGVVCKR